MVSSDLTLLRRRELVGLVAIIGWGVWIATGMVLMDGSPIALVVGWVFTAAWVAFDSSYRQTRFVAWTFLTLATGPVGLLLYYFSRPPAPEFCLRCGATLANTSKPCPACGWQSYLGRAKSALSEIYTRLADSLVRGPVETARTTAKHMAFAFVAAALLSLILSNAVRFFGVLYALSLAGYWVLVAWWVYLDATWRRMDGVPWAILALLTNVVGLVTYLVIRHPDPRTCGQCGATLTLDLKRCPYCGSQVDRVCPHCQAVVRPDWVYCPACAARLPIGQSAGDAAAGPSAPASVSIYGSVTDAATGSPIPDARVEVDSRSVAASATTDSSGQFVLADLSPRSCVLLASADGYAAEAKACVASAAGPARIHFALVPVGWPTGTSPDVEHPAADIRTPSDTAA